MSISVVDFSFKGLSSASEMLSHEASPGSHPVKRKSEKKFSSTSLRLNNNHLTDLLGLMDTISLLFLEPTRLTWLDLSFNNISLIDPVFSQFPELRLLYLHGNSIGKLSDVDTLAVLPSLHTITLHGNPIQAESDYRSHVIFTLPHVKKIDFSAVTKQERDLASIWHKTSKSTANPNTHKHTRLRLLH